MWSYQMITPSTYQSVSPADVSTWLRLNTADLNLLTGLIQAAEDQFTNDTLGYVLNTSTWQLNLDRWPQNWWTAPNTQGYIPESYAYPWIWQALSGVAPTIYITHAPVTSIVSVQYLDPASTYNNLIWDTLTGWTADLTNKPTRIILPTSLPSLHATIVPKIQVQFIAGHAVNLAPARAQLAVKLAAAHWYNNTMGDKGAYSTDSLKSVPLAWDAIVGGFSIGVSGNWNR